MSRVGGWGDRVGSELCWREWGWCARSGGNLQEPMPPLNAHPARRLDPPTSACSRTRMDRLLVGVEVLHHGASRHPSVGGHHWLGPFLVHLGRDPSPVLCTPSGEERGRSPLHLLYQGQLLVPSARGVSDIQDTPTTSLKQAAGAVAPWQPLRRVWSLGSCAHHLALIS